MPSRITREEAELLHLPNGRTVADEIAGFDRFSDLMDTRFKIAGVPFGLDSLLGLLPVAGDAITGAAGDVFDFFFRSHRKNFRVVEKHLIKRAKRHHKDLAKA